MLVKDGIDADPDLLSHLDAKTLLKCRTLSKATKKKIDSNNDLWLPLAQRYYLRKYGEKVQFKTTANISLRLALTKSNMRGEAKMLESEVEQMVINHLRSPEQAAISSASTSTSTSHSTLYLAPGVDISAQVKTFLDGVSGLLSLLTSKQKKKEMKRLSDRVADLKREAKLIPYELEDLVIKRPNYK